MRIDKFLWCVRLYKSRSMATEACQGGRIRINHREAKPAAEVRPNDRIAVRQPPIWRVFRITAIPGTRMSASLVARHLVDETPLEELQKQLLARTLRSGERDAGEGRPTKRERRDLDRAFGTEGT